MTRTVDTGADRPAPADDATARELRSAQVALAVFVGLLVAAIPIVLLGVGSFHWFFRDDFEFLMGREARSIDDLFRPHNAHWSTVPILAFRALWSVFGLRTYVPYQAAVLLLHLSVCALLRVIMRRVGVGPWIATAAAAAFVLFGPGQQNIIWAFQIGFTGSLAFGLAQLVLSDHDGAPDGRDVLGVFAGVLALMSSGVGITMAIIVGMATFARRGWRIALLHTAPLAVVYITWWLIERPKLTSEFGRPAADVVFRWVRSGEIGIFLALGHFQLVAVLLAVVLVLGLLLAWSRLPLGKLRQRAAIPGAMLIGVVVFLVQSAFGRWFFGSEFARSSRYVHIGAALTLPALAVAIDALARRWRAFAVPLIVLLLVAVPWNVDEFDDAKFLGRQYMENEKRVVTNVVRLPEAREVPRDVRVIPDAFEARYLAIGILLDIDEAGKLTPASGQIGSELANELRIRLGVAQRERGAPDACREVEGPLDIRPGKGTVFGITSPITVSTHDGSRSTSRPVPFNPPNGRSLTIELDGLDLRLSPARGAESFTLCDAAP
jgi:hypothetical protein